MLYAAAAVVNTDEPALALTELNEMSPTSGLHRIQTIYVVRNDRPAEFRLDLGDAGRFKADEFHIMASVVDSATGRVESVHSVGELQEMAEAYREQETNYDNYKTDDFNRRAVEQAERNWQRGYKPRR
jgi:hypothetical protein